MDRDLCANDVLENAVIGCRRPAFIMLRLQTINRYHDIELFVLAPGCRNHTKGTRHDLSVDAARLDLRDKLLEFTVSNEGIAANEGDVQRLLFVEQGQDAVDQLLSAKVGEFGQQSVVAEVSWVEGVAAGATQRALFGDLDGERWGATGQDPCPGMEYF